MSGSGTPLRFGVVGLGYWGPNLLRVLADIEEVEVAWICDLDAERLDVFRRRYPAVQATRELADVLQDPSVDAVLLATPVFTHHALAARCLNAGKHTFVEKPLASSGELASELVELADATDRVLMCGLTFIYSPPVRTVKELLARNELGEVYFVSSSRVNLGLHQRDVSVIWDLGPHDFSILLYWLQERPSSVRAVGRDSIVRGIPDVAFVTLTFPSGIVANIELSWLSPSKLRRTVVVGSDKMVVYEDGSPEPIRLFDHGVVYQDPETFGEYHLSYRTGDIVSPKVETYEPLRMELRHFADAVASGEPARANIELAEQVVHLTEAADRSLRAGGAEVALATPELFASLRPRNGDALWGDDPTERPRGLFSRLTGR
jgi:predicted dehydrogenase